MIKSSYIGIGFFLCMLSSLMLHAQRDTLGNPASALHVYTSFPQADQIEVDAEGNIFLLGREEGVLYKYLAAHAYDSAIIIGGISTREDGFLHPQKIAIKNRQDFYVLDDLGRKIVLLDKELKRVQSSDFYAISSNSSLGIPDEFEPSSFDISGAGEIFVLNQANNKIYKINAFGDIELQFGGLDFGEGSLYQPDDIQVSADNRIFVSDFENQEIKVFDLFGVFLEHIPMQDASAWKNFHIYENSLVLWNSQQLLIKNLISMETHLYPISTQAELKDLYISREIIYLLLENEVHLYPKTE